MDKRIPEKYLKDVIKRSLKEDIGKGDITTSVLFPENFEVESELVSKENGVICGLDVFRRIFLHLSSDFSFKFFCKDGETVKRNYVVANIRGPLKEMLAGERTALNFLQRLSGIATLTRKFVNGTKEKKGKSGFDKSNPYKEIIILDTRKTTPGVRALEKYAVRVGGGENHRFGLYDMVLIKDNHITAYMMGREKIDSCFRRNDRLCGNDIMEKNGLPRYARNDRLLDSRLHGNDKLFGNDKEQVIYEIVKRAKGKVNKKYKIEIEVENFVQAKAAYEAGADIIMFDNASSVEVKKFAEFASKAKKRKVFIEWSGGVDLKSIKRIKELPVDFVSVGLLTHSAPSLDLSLNIINR